MLFSNILTNPIFSKIQIFVTSHFRTLLETAPVCSRIKLLFSLNFMYITINFSRFVSVLYTKKQVNYLFVLLTGEGEFAKT